MFSCLVHVKIYFNVGCLNRLDSLVFRISHLF